MQKIKEKISNELSSETRLSPTTINKHWSTSMMSTPKMSQIFYCHQDQWIQYFATARNIPDSKISYAPSTEKLKVVIASGITSTSKDNIDEMKYKNFTKHQSRSIRMKAEKTK